MEKEIIFGPKQVRINLNQIHKKQTSRTETETKLLTSLQILQSTDPKKTEIRITTSIDQNQDTKSLDTTTTAGGGNTLGARIPAEFIDFL